MQINNNNTPIIVATPSLACFLYTKNPNNTANIINNTEAVPACAPIILSGFATSYAKVEAQILVKAATTKISVA